VGALLLRALEAARETLYQRARVTLATPSDAEPPAFPQRQADALALVAEAALRHYARTARPSWAGERLDVGWAIDVLHPLALASRGGPFTPWCPVPEGEASDRGTTVVSECRR